MTKEFNPRNPDFSGHGVSIWKAEDKNGKTYLKVKILNLQTINCFEVEPKIKTQKF
jgi:hypothetical protein